MCGRTGLSLDRDQVQCACSYKPKGCSLFKKPDWLSEHNAEKEYKPSYNIAPTDVTPILVSSSKFKNATSGDRVLKPMMWGIIPPWHKGEYNTHKLSTNNCRLENIKSSRLYGPILKNGGRCIIVVEGFYEWQTTNKTAKVKQPYYIYAPQNSKTMIDDANTWTNNYTEEKGWNGLNLLHIAGLYDVWQNGDTIIYAYSVITMESNEIFNWLHSRIPAILETQDQIKAWLDTENVTADLALGYIKPIKTISWHKVSTAVNNSRNKSEDCNKRIKVEDSKKSQKSLTAWFVKTEKRKISDECISEVKKIKLETCPAPDSLKNK